MGLLHHVLDANKDAWKRNCSRRFTQRAQQWYGLPRSLCRGAAVNAARLGQDRGATTRCAKQRGDMPRCEPTPTLVVLVVSAVILFFVSQNLVLFRPVQRAVGFGLVSCVLPIGSFLPITFFLLR
jgi:hypothetical protein